MRMHKPPPINDIKHCLEDAHTLAMQIAHIRRIDFELYSAFNSLASDEMTGLLAYVIWRSRSQWIASLRWIDPIGYDE